MALMRKKPKRRKGDEEPKNKGGRPRKALVHDQVAAMLQIMCTAQEICNVYGIVWETLDARVRDWGYDGFSDMKAQYSATGKMSLRREQWKVAKKGNVTMLKHLGEHWLEQHSKASIDHTSSDKSMSPAAPLAPEELLREAEARGLPPCVLNALQE
jgi:hypothetical protein